MSRLIDVDALCNDLLNRWSIADTRKEELIQAVMADIVTPIIACQPIIEPEPQWIPCSERLPEEFGEYLVTKKDVGWNCEEYYRNDIAYWDTSFHKANEVVAWMPLPEPYKGES